MNLRIFGAVIFFGFFRTIANAVVQTGPCYKLEGISYCEPAQSKPCVTPLPCQVIPICRTKIGEAQTVIKSPGPCKAWNSTTTCTPETGCSTQQTCIEWAPPTCDTVKGLPCYAEHSTVQAKPGLVCDPTTQCEPKDPLPTGWELCSSVTCPHETCN